MALSIYLGSFADELLKIAEYAKGIPSREVSHELPKVDEPTTWEFAIHSHEAEKRGPHYDLRLGDPETGHAHSWAMQKRWPKPGESAWAIQQPTHTVKYMDFEGRIPSGYGKGDVSLHARDKVEVTESRPGHINFNVYKTTGPEEYTLHRMADKTWSLINRTPHRSKLNLPSEKPKYREVDASKVDKHIENDEWLASAKIDDAHNLFLLPASGEPIRVVSYREAKRGETGVIEHTHKVPSIVGRRTPKGMGGTVIRGGLYAMNPSTGRATEAKDIGGLLNSNVWKSREKQKQYGELRPVIYDVVKFRGKDMEKAPYDEKLKVLQHIAKELSFELPEMAHTAKEKRDLLERVRTGKVPETSEGVVFWNRRKGEAPVKAKFVDDHDVYIRGFFPGEGKYSDKAVGGFTFSHEPEGPIVGRVGTGLSDKLRLDMKKNPEKYMGLVARVTAQNKYQSGALRAPSFQGWHLDKNDPEDLSQVVG